MSFTADMSKFCKVEAPGILDGTVRKIVIEVGNRLVYRSPVGDSSYWLTPAPPGYVGGRFRGSWAYGFGAPSEADTIDPSGAATISRIITGALSSKAIGVHFITNNLPYAEALESGRSRQAPQGMIGLTELEFPQIVAMAKL